MGCAVAILMTAQSVAASDEQANEGSSPALSALQFGGPLSERLKLTGDWGGLRDTWAENGVTIDFDMTHITQWVVDGGYDGPIAARLLADTDDVETGASIDLVFQLDTEKAGLWPGGTLKIRGEARFGDYLLGRTGTISPVAMDALAPLNDFNESTIDISEFTYTQFLSEKFGIFVGLLNTFEGDNTFFASGRGDTQFLNTGMNFNLAIFTGMPYQSLGGGLVLIPNGDPAKALGTLTIMNTEDASGRNPFDYTGGTTANTEWYFGYTVGERPGQFMVAGTYADYTFSDLDPDPRLSLLPGTAKGEKSDTWNIYFNLSQYLQMYDHAPESGWGFFARLGFSDGNPNPVDWFGSIGLGGNTPWRAQDTFGIGLYHASLSSDALNQNERIDDETGFELFYNFGVTPWLHVTADLQVVDSGLPDAETPVMLGLRTRWSF
jgi:porin